MFLVPLSSAVAKNQDEMSLLISANEENNENAIKAISFLFTKEISPVFSHCVHSL
jgi:pyridoxal/pyridoxine/pyridoxamine kinase